MTDKSSVAHGTALASVGLWVGLAVTLKARGIISRDEISAIADYAMYALEQGGVARDGEAGQAAHDLLQTVLRAIDDQEG